MDGISVDGEGPRSASDRLLGLRFTQKRKDQAGVWQVYSVSRPSIFVSINAEICWLGI
jgi:hypothetical protein